MRLEASQAEGVAWTKVAKAKGAGKVAVGGFECQTERPRQDRVDGRGGVRSRARGRM